VSQSTRSPAALGRVLIVDDDLRVRETMRDYVEHLGYSVRDASSAEEALAEITRETPDLVLLDVRMPGINGIDLCRQLKGDPMTHLIPVVLLTAERELDSRVAGLEAGADDYFTKPVHPRELEARLRSLVRLRRALEELEEAESLITSLALTIEARDPYTAGHCVRLAARAMAFGERLGLGEDDLKALRLGGFLHDLGKIAVPDGILLKAGPLSAEERRLMEGHPAAGDRLLGPMRTLGLVRPIIRHHHERWDGRGYPDRIGGEEVPLLARLMAIVDVHDALCTQRPYKSPYDEEDALGSLREGARTGQFDPDLVRVFLELRRTSVDRRR
jgi:putative two-component system response regulator